MRPIEKFHAYMRYGNQMSKNQKIIYDRYKDRNCVAFYFVTRDRLLAYMIIKTKRSGFLGFCRYTNRDFDGRDYTLYPKPILEVFKDIEPKMGRRYEDEQLMKELHEWRILNAI